MKLRLVIGLILLALFLIINFNNLDPDLGWHLRSGQFILFNHAVPHTDAFSNAMPGYEWVDHEWLLQLIFAWFARYRLWPLLQIIFALLWFLPIGIWLWRARRFPEIFVVTMAALLLLGYLGVRPHLVSYLFYFAVLEICYARYVRASQTKFFYILPLIFLLWANLHGGFPAGIAILAIFTLASRSFRVIDLSVLTASIGATFLNPYGWHLYQEAFRVFSSPYLAKYINEWQSAFLLPVLPSSVTLSVLVLLGLTGMFALPVFVLARFRKKYPWPVLLTGGIMFIAFIKTLKLGPLYFLTALSVLADGFNLARAEINRKLEIWKILKFGPLLFLLAFALLWYGSASGTQIYPESATRVLQVYQANGLAGNVFNVYDWGGYLLWQAPEVKVFIDGRMPHWRDKNGYSAMADYVKVMYPESRDWQWQEVFARKNITTAILKNSPCPQSPEPNFITNLFANFTRKAAAACRLVGELKNQHWKILYEDEVAVILHK